MKKITIKNLLLLYFAILGIGITIGDLIEWGVFDWDKSISVIEALDLFITVGLTLYIATVIEKRLKNKQIEAELIFEQINEIETIIKDLNFSSKNQIPLIEINLIVHKISLVKNNVFKYLNENIKSDEMKIREKEFKECLKNLKDLLTNTPIDKNDKSKISISNNLVKYSDDRIKEIVTELYSFKTELFKLKLFVSHIE